jgi:hypothetical protein
VPPPSSCSACSTTKMTHSIRHKNDTFHQALESQARNSKRSRSHQKLCWRDNSRTGKQQPCREEGMPASSTPPTPQTKNAN